ncbi:hypothetical protein [Photobacterium kasasachensis]|uniref:hypothetical protein n=1 Tax=Photobacterium kasasachensis TaxID=2910240 RepID=UPI003D0B3188
MEYLIVFIGGGIWFSAVVYILFRLHSRWSLYRTVKSQVISVEGLPSIILGISGNEHEVSRFKVIDHGVDTGIVIHWIDHKPLIIYLTKRDLRAIIVKDGEILNAQLSELRLNDIRYIAAQSVRLNKWKKFPLPPEFENA